MIQFLYPLGLLAAIGIIVPIIVHLWNIKKGKTLKIGSISLLGAAVNQRSGNLRISDWPLLLLRCLLLVLLAFLLAVPAYEKKVTKLSEPGWILVEKHSLNQVWKENKKEIDSLLKKGYGILDFNIGFSKLELKDTATRFSKSSLPPLSYYSLIRQFDAEKSAGASIYLYTDKRLNRFEGTQPYAHLNVHWKTFSIPADSLSAPKILPAVIASDQLQVLIYSNGLSTDAAYLKAAVLAIGDFTNRKITVKEISNAAQITKQANLVFWLADHLPNAAQFKKLPMGISFLNYAGLKTERLKSVIQYEPGSAKEIPLYQRKNIPAKPGQMIWSDGFGVPLLTLDYSSSIKHYQFYSRFNQDWTDLVWSNGLAEALMPLVIPHQEVEFGFPEDTATSRTVSKIPMPIRTQSRQSAIIAYQQHSLSSLVWWLLIVVLFIERFLSYSKTARRE